MSALNVHTINDAIETPCAKSNVRAPSGRAMAAASAVAEAFLTAHAPGMSDEERIERVARVIDRAERSYERAPALGDAGTPESVLAAACERFLDRDGMDVFVDLLDGTFDVRRSAHCAAESLRIELTEYQELGNELPAPED